jgi:Ca2+-binding RTX toxin-like protein
LSPLLPNFGKTDTNAIDLSKLGDESKYTIDYLGDKNDNILTGTTKDEIFVAGAGNDTLTGNGGMDVLDRHSKHPQLNHLSHHR